MHIVLFMTLLVIATWGLVYYASTHPNDKEK